MPKGLSNFIRAIQQIFGSAKAQTEVWLGPVSDLYC